MQSSSDTPGVHRSLEGRWRKLTTDAALDEYPAEITFAADTYLARRGPEQKMIWWDAGIYRVQEPASLVLSTATDEMVTYAMQRKGNRLMIEIPDLGTVRYERMEGPPPS